MPCEPETGGLRHSKKVKLLGSVAGVTLGVHGEPYVAKLNPSGKHS